MVVLIDLTSLDDNFTGIEHYAFYITKELIKNEGIDFHLVFKNKISHFSKEELDAKNVTYHIIEGGRFSILLKKLPKYIDQYKPDYALFLAFPPSLLWKPKGSTKVISMIHDMVCSDMPKTMKFKSRLFFKYSIKHSLKISNSIITNSNFSKSRILHHYPKFNQDKIHIAYCGCAMSLLERNREEIESKYSLPKKYLLALSTLEPRKNFDTLIKYLDSAYSSIDSLPDLVVVGRKGWLVDKILEGVKNSNRIHFTGFVDDEDIYDIYKNAECFIFPSKYEGFGIPLLESLKANVLPLCSSIDVFKEILGEDYPFYFDYKDEAGFIKALEFYLNYPIVQKNDILDKTIARVSKFNWKDSSSVIKQLFK